MLIPWRLGVARSQLFKSRGRKRWFYSPDTSYQMQGWKYPDKSGTKHPAELDAPMGKSNPWELGLFICFENLSCWIVQFLEASWQHELIMKMVSVVLKFLRSLESFPVEGVVGTFVERMMTWKNTICPKSTMTTAPPQVACTTEVTFHRSYWSQCFHK